MTRPIVFAVIILATTAATVAAIGVTPGLLLVAWTFAGGWMVDRCCR